MNRKRIAAPLGESRAVASGQIGGCATCIRIHDAQFQRNIPSPHFWRVSAHLHFAPMSEVGNERA